MKTTFIYGLIDPRDNQIKYVGKSNNPSARLGGHVSCRASGEKGRWIAELGAMGLLPIITVLEETTEAQWSEREQHWIAAMRASGCALLNVQAGGGGNQLPFNRTRAHTGEGAQFNYRILKEKRLSLGYSQEEIAELMDISLRRYVDLETKCNNNPTLDTLSKLARVFGIRVIDLILEG